MGTRSIEFDIDGLTVTVKVTVTNDVVTGVDVKSKKSYTPKVVKKWKVPSDSEYYTKYTVKYEDGIWSCECDDFIKRGKLAKGETCKHIRRVMMNPHLYTRIL